MGNVTKSQKNNITSPNGNSLAIFVDAEDEEAKLKDVLGNVEKLTKYLPPYVQKGFGRYDDSQYTQSSPLNLSTGIEVKLPNNANYVYNIGDFMFYDASSGKLLSQYENDCYQATLVFKAKSPNANQTHLEIKFTGADDYDRISNSVQFYKQNNEWQNFYLMYQFYADSNVVQNGLEVNITSFGSNSSVSDIIFFIQRTQIKGY